MFSGIIEAVGTVGAFVRRGADAQIRIAAGALSVSDVRIGDSIAVNGVCLTVTAVGVDAFDADLSAETLARTTFNRRAPGDKVNLEKALAVGQRLGGHLVSGHVDGIGRLAAREAEGRSLRLAFVAPAELGRYIAEKGSVCIDGVSLTVNQAEGNRFSVNLVPHTLRATTLDALAPGDEVNVEVDLIARYLERLLQGEAAGSGGMPSGGSAAGERNG